MVPTQAPLRMVPPLPTGTRNDGLIQVRMAPLVMMGEPSIDGGDTVPTEAVVDRQLIVDYTGALARRAAGNIRDGLVVEIEHHHQHPTTVACLRCAVLDAAEQRTVLATTLLEILTRTNADEAWNNDVDACTDVKMISRLRRLAISSATMAELYGPRWGAVMLMCLRAERADFELLDYLTRRYQPSRCLQVHTRDSLAAYHLAMVCCPQISHDGRSVTSVKRNAVAVRLAVTAASVAVGENPEWLDHLPAPAL